MAKAHIVYTMWLIARNLIENKEWKDARIKPILLDLLRISALQELKDNSGHVFDAGFFVPGNQKLVAEAQCIMI